MSKKSSKSLEAANTPGYYYVDIKPITYSGFIAGWEGAVYRRDSALGVIIEESTSIVAVTRNGLIRKAKGIVKNANRTSRYHAERVYL